MCPLKVIFPNAISYALMWALLYALPYVGTVMLIPILYIHTCQECNSNDLRIISTVTFSNPFSYS